MDIQALEIIAEGQPAVAEAAETLAALLRETAALAREALPAPQPQPAVQARQRARHRYIRVERPETGVAVADIVNETTGEVRRFRFTRKDDGSIEMQEE
jgi:hypothetical protein